MLHLELGDQSGLDLLDLQDGLLADGHEALDGLSALLQVVGSEPHRSLDVVALNRVFDEVGTNVGALGAGRPGDACATEEVGIVPAEEIKL